MKILNLYAGIGGNRTLWGNDHKVTAVEIDRRIAKVYQERFPEDIVVIGDAHIFLLEHFSDFDFIWTSPPCITHTKLNIAGLGQGRKPRYPSMQLYEEILLLRTFVNEKPIWVVENTHPYYQPVVSPTQRIGRHLIWSNIHFNVGRIVRTPHLIVKSQRQLQSWLGISVNKIKGMDGIRWRQVIRNCFHPKIAESMLEDVKSHLGVSRKQIVNSRFFNPKE